MEKHYELFGERIINNKKEAEHNPIQLKPVLEALQANGMSRAQLIKIVLESFDLSEAEAALLVAKALDGPTDPELDEHEPDDDGGPEPF